VPHCGVCSQCIDRKFAVYAAEVENYEGKDFYAFDFLSEDIVKEGIKKSLTEYIKIAQSYCENDINNFFLYRGPELIEIDEFLDGKDEEERIGKVFDLCRRHSKQIESAINSMREKYDSPFAKLKPKSFFYSILGLREYQKSSQTNETLHKNKSEDELQRDNEMLTNELGNAHQVIKRYNKVKYAKIDYTKYPYSKVAQIADQTRKINKKLNFKKIAENLGVSDKTAHSICNYHHIT
jgi:hypothetical protein